MADCRVSKEGRTDRKWTGPKLKEWDGSETKEKTQTPGRVHEDVFVTSQPEWRDQGGSEQRWGCTPPWAGRRRVVNRSPSGLSSNRLHNTQGLDPASLGTTFVPLDLGHLGP